MHNTGIFNSKLRNSYLIRILEWRTHLVEEHLDLGLLPLLDRLVGVGLQGVKVGLPATWHQNGRESSTVTNTCDWRSVYMHVCLSDKLKIYNTKIYQSGYCCKY